MITRFSLVQGSESCREVDDRSCLGMFGRCRILGSAGRVVDELQVCDKTEYFEFDLIIF